ncbi:MAG TPA: peptidylprolyl isomerase [Bryobacteraceae bacterium]|nr:peptidylprolyl isomerase [Bryobacteraceae bacterium]
MRIRLWLAALVVLAGCGSKEPAAKAPEKKREATQAPAIYKVRMETTKGPIVVEVHRDWAPRGADHFYTLVQEKFYDGVKFHRVVRRFVAQFGINPDMKKDQLWRTLELPDDAVKQKNVRGTLTFAARGPNTRTTQLFFNLTDNSALLDKDGFAPLGKVVEGLEILDQLAFVYGDMPPRGSGPDPKQIQTIGYSYLDREFPRLDTITTAKVTE